MVTRKKKVDKTEDDLLLSTDAKSARKSKTVWPKVSQGSHLTVKTFEDGRTELAWDDAALEQEVREAIAAYELEQLKPSVRAKSATRKKKSV